MIPKDDPHRIGEFLENVPEELKRMDQWVNWSKLWNEDKTQFSKPPMRASGRNASSTDEKTWTSFEKSVAALGRDGVYKDNSGKKHNVTLDGIGFAGIGRTGYSGLDFDHCIDPETGEMNPAVQEIIEKLDSYTEITPSGRGVRIWIEAEKPPGSWSANKTGEIEIEVYTTGRFFTVTGRHMEGTPRSIEQRQDVFDALMERHAPSPAPGKKSSPPKREYEGRSGLGDYRFDLPGWLDKHGVTILKRINDATSELAFAVVCPWAHEHTGGDTSGTRAGQFPSGAPWFECEHGHCKDLRKWVQVRELLDEDYREANMAVGGLRPGARRRRVFKTRRVEA